MRLLVLFQGRKKQKDMEIENRNKKAKIFRFCSDFDFFGSRSGIKKDTILIVSCFVK
jgi:hypothetical protein